jgi:hypothetical protein
MSGCAIPGASSKLLPVRTVTRIYARNTGVVKVSIANNNERSLINENGKSAFVVLTDGSANLYSRRYRKGLSVIV